MNRATLRSLLLLWLAGLCLRITVLAVPPVLPGIHRDLHLDERAVGALTALPVLLLAAAAVLGSLLVAHLGPRRALLLGLIVVALGGAARGIGTSVAVLFAMTFVMGAGIAVSQPAMPSLVRQWAPERIGLATAAYSNGTLIGELLAASLAVPLVLPLVGGSWQRSLAVWSLPILGTIAAITLLTRPNRTVAVKEPSAWWPEWRNPHTWRLGLVFGCASIAYFGSNAFIPDYLKATHHAGLITPALTVLNAGQLPASFLVALFPRRLIARRLPLLFAGMLIFFSSVAFRLGGLWVVVSSFWLGLGCGLVLVLVLALPPLLAEEHDVHRLSAGIFSITYMCSFLGSLLGGAIWDATGIPITGFLPIMASGVVMIGLIAGLHLRPRSSVMEPVGG